jgi:hypothetical protein
MSTPLAQWLVADGEFVDIGMGSPGDTRNANVFKYGGFYGQQWIQLGDISGTGGDGTSQKFRSFGGFRSPGPVWFRDAYSGTTFWDPETSSGSAVVNFPGVPTRPDGPEPALAELAQGHVKYEKLPLPPIVETMDQVIGDSSVTTKIDLAAVPPSANPPDSDPSFRGLPFIRPAQGFRNVYGDPRYPTILIDFGKPRYVRGARPEQSDDPIRYGPPDDDRDPARVTRLLYARDRNIVVWGCPDRDVIIYTNKDIYVAGDFNQSPWHHQTYTSQIDAQVADADGRDSRYIDPVRFAVDPEYASGGEPPGLDLDSLERSRGGYGVMRPVRRDDPEARASVGGTEERKLALLIAGSRIWFDYRNPSRFMANELVPWLEYRLLLSMGVPPASALPAMAYAADADVSQADKASVLNFSGPLTPMTPAAADQFVTQVLKFQPGTPGAQRALPILQRLATPRIEDVPVVAEELFHNVVRVEDVRQGAAARGLFIQNPAQGAPPAQFGLAQDYYSSVFVTEYNSQNLNQIDRNKHPALTQDLARRLRFYLPEQTINAVLVDGAKRFDGQTWYTKWDVANPKSDGKIYAELGNSRGSSSVYLRYTQNQNLFMSASPVIGRVHGLFWNLRQTPPDPNLYMKGEGAYLPHKRKRIFDVGLASFAESSFRLAGGGFGGLRSSAPPHVWLEVDINAGRGSQGASFKGWFDVGEWAGF